MRKPEPVSLAYLAISNAFNELGESLFRLIGVPVVLCSPDDQHVVNQRWYESPNAICRLLRTHPEGCAYCAASDRARFAQAVATKRAVHGPCHAGFIDVAIPVMSRGSVIGIISIGQYLPEPPSDEGFLRFQQLHARFGFPLDALRAGYESAPYLPPEKIQILIKLTTFFAEHLCELNQLIQHQVGDRYHEMFKAAQDFIEHHLHEELTIRQLAHHLQRSPRYVSELFRRVTNMAFTDYLQQRRIEEVKRMLAHPHLPITDIAFACGFSSISQFNRTFQKFEHCTPREIRRRLLESDNAE